MAHYAAFDVSDKETAIHVLDGHGGPVWKGRRPSEPEALAAALRRHAPALLAAPPLLVRRSSGPAPAPGAAPAA